MLARRTVVAVALVVVASVPFAGIRGEVAASSFALLGGGAALANLIYGGQAIAYLTVALLTVLTPVAIVSGAVPVSGAGLMAIMCFGVGLSPAGSCECFVTSSGAHPLGHEPRTLTATGGHPHRRRASAAVSAGRRAEVDRSTTERNRGSWPDELTDKTARQRPGGHRVEAIQDVAKVGVAGSNPVVRSRDHQVRSAAV